jgi:DNA-binding response OmpR family regulator
MPGMDGIDTTRLIRKHESDYAKNIPIIALTANAVAGNEQMFLEEGFQAFVSKPINIIKLDKVIQKWITRKPPVNNIQPETDTSPPPADGIPGVNMKSGLSLYEDDMDMFLIILNSYATNIPAELEKLRGVTKENLHEYALTVHTVKGASSTVGAQSVTELARELEMKAKAGDLAGVQASNERLIADAELLVTNIREWLSKRDAE